ncbi:hypothetical protein [Vibrio vulnificus]|uniref:hypothetical protein n=1 Tax=Vibrio vulnificus TaxID=672 RepID=UPI00188D7CC5|nr:hypothetical protein [Vibrio vulnificus]EIO3979888.1 hypothetical protein [Vibrio vulnificus]MBF4449565.1 hypothetical protein [Vibrio vulnificus]MBF4495013.1 hypothetical protein [Vibrio vulnificus]MBL6180283.1 hypothetical protein [Vibrio vulnificus]HDY7979414.1 hypothetical protein [Vibrio vulnificus]
MTELSFYLRANKSYIVLVLMITNLLLIGLAENMSVRMIGKMEALGYRWATYTNLHRDELHTRVTYSKIDEVEVNFKNIDYTYKLDDISQNEYISVGQGQPATVRHNRVYYLDDICNLTFSGRSEMTLENVALRCLY